jgi:hypothetical protein
MNNKSRNSLQNESIRPNPYSLPKSTYEVKVHTAEFTFTARVNLKLAYGVPKSHMPSPTIDHPMQQGIYKSKLAAPSSCPLNKSASATTLYLINYLREQIRPNRNHIPKKNPQYQTPEFPGNSSGNSANQGPKRPNGTFYTLNPIQSVPNPPQERANAVDLVGSERSERRNRKSIATSARHTTRGSRIGGRGRTRNRQGEIEREREGKGKITLAGGASELPAADGEGDEHETT